MQFFLLNFPLVELFENIGLWAPLNAEKHSLKGKKKESLNYIQLDFSLVGILLLPKYALYEECSLKANWNLHFTS